MMEIISDRVQGHGAWGEKGEMIGCSSAAGK